MKKTSEVDKGINISQTSSVIMNIENPNNNSSNENENSSNDFLNDFSKTHNQM